jgi:hypothetical protein
VKVGILGATGPAGRGLALRLSQSGVDVLVGSRDITKAQRVVGDLRAKWGDAAAHLEPVINADAVKRGELIVLAVSAEATVLTAIEYRDVVAGKVLVSMANGMRKVDGGFAPVISPLGSIAEEVAAVCPEAIVVAAFQHLPAPHLVDLDHALGDDVLVCSDDDQAKKAVGGLVACLPSLRAVDAGPLANASALEALTAVLVTVNIHYKTHAGIRLTGIGP